MQDQTKTFVIDTNVLIHNPEAIMSFRDNEVVIPLWVLEELDHLKTYPDQRGKAAREAIRFIATAAKEGNLREGVRISNGSTLRVVLTIAKDIPEGFVLDKNDNKIIMTAYALHEEGRRVFFVSKDINARVKAESLGIHTVDYEKQKVDITTLYTGYRELDVSAETFDAFERDLVMSARDPFGPNGYAILTDKVNSRTSIGRYDPATQMIRHIPGSIDPVCGIQALNERQRIALDLLLDDSVPLVTLVGKAGTGKTLLAIAAGLRKVIEEKRYTRMLVSRPVVPLGKDIGYLPGEKTAKMANWMEPLFDNLEYILGIYNKPNFRNVDQLIKNKTIELEALSFIRGRTLPEQYIIIDEAQNLTPHEVKTVVSRAGEHTKMVLTGDPDQIDNMYLDANSNGLTYLVDAFKGQAVFGHVTLQKSERSTLAELAAELL